MRLTYPSASSSEEGDRYLFGEIKCLKVKAGGNTGRKKQKKNTHTKGQEEEKNKTETGRERRVLAVKQLHHIAAVQHRKNTFQLCTEEHTHFNLSHEWGSLKVTQLQKLGLVSVKAVRAARISPHSTNPSKS